jgi:hypothetical protein
MLVRVSSNAVPEADGSAAITTVDIYAFSEAVNTIRYPTDLALHMLFSLSFLEYHVRAYMSKRRLFSFPKTALALNASFPVDDYARHGKG